MRRVILAILCALCACPLPHRGYAQETTDPFTGFNFMWQPFSARDEALGATGVGTVGTAMAMMYNPAGLAFVEGLDAGFTLANTNRKRDDVWISEERRSANLDWDERNYVVGFAVNAGRKWSLGLSVQTYDHGFDDEDVSQYAVSGACGRRIADRLAVGAALKLVHEALPVRSVFGSPRMINENVYAFDLGAYYVSESGSTVIALGARNLTGGFLGEQGDYLLPKRIRAGVLIDLVSTVGLEPLPHYLDLAADLYKPIRSFGHTALRVGIEYTYLMRRPEGYTLGISLRGGHAYPNPVGWGCGLEFMSAGGRRVAVDYARTGLGVGGDEAYIRAIINEAIKDDVTQLVSVSIDM